MRLTLRALLAYMHGLLPPQEAEIIARKIEESPVAKQLMERIADVVRRRSLDAPEVDDQRANLDPNTVAEYLDHVLPPERVPDLERVCFESDEQLAEVASCHLILTKVLTEPVQISEASLQRMYALAQSAGIAGEAVDIPPSEGERRTDDRGKVPPAIVGVAGRRAHRPARFFPLVVRLIITALLGAVALGFGVVGLLLLTGQLREDSALMAFLRGEPAVPGRRAVEFAPSEGPSPATAVPSTTEEVPTPGGGELTPPGEKTLSTEDAAVALESTGEPPTAATPAPTDGEGASEKVSRETEAVAIADKPEQPEVADKLVQPETVQREFGPGPMAETAAASPEVAAEARPLLLELITRQEVLLEFDEAASAWRRVDPEGKLKSGVDYLAVPGFAPIVRVGPQSLVMLVGATKLSFRAGEAPGEVELEVGFGRLVFRDVPDRYVVRIAPPVDVRVVAITPRSRWAVETYGKHCGPEPPSGAETAVARIWWLEGQGEVILPDGQARQMTKGTELGIGPAEAIVQTQKDFPEWTGWEHTFSQPDLLARPIVDKEVRPDKGALVAFRELAGHRRQEVRLFAYRALHALEDYDLLVAALGNSDNRQGFLEIAGLLARAYQAGSPAADNIRTALRRHGREQAEQVAEIAFAPETKLEVTQYAQLVEALRSPVMAVRVMAFWRLNRDTKLTFDYRPHDDPRNQRASLGRWEEWLRGLTKTADQPAGGLSVELRP